MKLCEDVDGYIFYQYLKGFNSMACSFGMKCIAIKWFFFLFLRLENTEKHGASISSHSEISDG